MKFVSYICSLSLLCLIGFGIVKFRQEKKDLSLADYAPIVEVEGVVETIEEVDSCLEIRFQNDERLFRCVSGYSEIFYRRNFIETKVKPGETLTLSVPESELAALSVKKRWKWAEVIGIKSAEQVWLSPDDFIIWQKENTQALIWILMVIFLAPLLWLMKLRFPVFTDSAVDGLGWVLKEAFSAKGWVMAGVILLLLIPAGKKCWLDNQLSDAPIHKGEVIDCREIKSFFIATRFILEIRPVGSEMVVKADARPNTPDQVAFRWDGKSEWVYLREAEGSPWKEFFLILGLGIGLVLIALICDFGMKES